MDMGILCEARRRKAQQLGNNQNKATVGGCEARAKEKEKKFRKFNNECRWNNKKKK